MKEFEVEWGYYLQAYRLQQGLSRDSNAESQRLLRRALEVARQNERELARGQGLLSFTILSAWLNDWINSDMEAGLVAGCLQDVGPTSQAGASLVDAIDAYKQAPDRAALITSVINAYGQNALVLDQTDYENHWSTATANLYKGDFASALAGYKAALELADKPDVPVIGLGSLMVDFADFRFFAGDDGLEDSKAAWVWAINDAIQLTNQAIDSNQDDGKRHRWNWTLGWAYYELAAYTDPAANLTLSRENLEKLRNPHDLIRKNLIVTYTALGMADKAAEHAGEFKTNNPNYEIDVENRWPYRSKARLDRWKGHLAAGLATA